MATQWADAMSEAEEEEEETIEGYKEEEEQEQDVCDHLLHYFPNPILDHAHTYWQ